tara:strand:- start:587 stop:1912 length:1326 start_codon:yes stop_codon:yes gene_type:complete
LVLIFVIAFASFLLAPKLLNYEKKIPFIKSYLNKHYNLELKSYNNIKYNIYPLPNLKISNAKLKIINDSIFINSDDLNIFLSLNNIYQFKNFTAKKIYFKNNIISLEFEKIRKLFGYVNSLKHKTKFERLNLKLFKEKKTIIEIKDLSFINYGFNKNKIYGKVFNKKFKVNYQNKENINFKMLKSGINANIKIISDDNDKKSINGNSKINLLKNYLKINFKLKEDQIEIFNSNFSSKSLKMNIDGAVKYSPYFQVTSNFKINKINKDFFQYINFEDYLEKKQLIKKMNSKNVISFDSKKYRSTFLKSLKLKFNLAHGRLIFSKKILMNSGHLNCKGESLLIEEYPRLIFKCFIKITNKDKLFKKLQIKKDFPKNSTDINIEGSLNLLNKKINIKKMIIDEKIVAIEDLKFFKQNFENILFDENFINIFQREKIKKFILEVI